MYTANDYSHLLGLDGFSDDALNTHIGLYEGYVKKTNELMEKLEEHMKAKTQATPEFAEMRRRFGWEWNGMRLHEYYFGSLSKEASDAKADSPFMSAIEKHFGSFDAWREDFIATAALRGIGWGILYYDQQKDMLCNDWVNEHDQGHLAGATILLNIDVFEHAFVIDYGMKRADYIDAFMAAVDWSIVEERFITAAK